MSLSPEDIKPGRIYRAKRPQDKFLSIAEHVICDRQVLRVSLGGVQYDGPSVKPGSHYPTTTMQRFLSWAAYDCTDEMPADGKWHPAPLSPAQKEKCRDALKRGIAPKDQ